MADAALVTLALAPMGAHAAGPAGRPETTGAGEGPAISAETPEGRPGDTVLVHLSGFRAGAVVVSVCGNEARRGSSDCDQPGGTGRRLNDPTGTTVTDMTVTAPPVPCPCVLLAASAGFDEVATTPFTVAGHPSAPVQEPSTDPPLEVSLRAFESPRGLLDRLRADLGGPTEYEVEVTVRNSSSRPVGGVELEVTASRSGGDDVASAMARGPEAIAPGEQWRTTIRRQLPAPAVGRFVWSASVSGQGVPAATQARDIDRLPAGLVLLVAVLVLDVGAVVGSRVVSHRARRRLATAG